MSDQHELRTTITDLIVEQWQSLGEQHKIDVQGYSMWPLLLPGDQIDVIFGRNTPSLHDIILFRQNDRLIVHRVLHVHLPTAIVARGDNRRQCDPLVDQTMLLGTVVARIRKGQRLDLQTRRGRAFSKTCLIVAQTQFSLKVLARKLGVRRPAILKRS